MACYLVRQQRVLFIKGSGKTAPVAIFNRLQPFICNMYIAAYPELNNQHKVQINLMGCFIGCDYTHDMP